MLFSSINLIKIETLGSCNNDSRKNNQHLACWRSKTQAVSFVCVRSLMPLEKTLLHVYKHTYAIIHCPFAVLIHMINCEKPN